MKRTAFVVLMVVSAVALFANGAREDDREPVWNPVEITGTVTVVDGYPVLTARGTTYLLGAPRAAWYLDEIEDGQTITIRGQLVENPVVDVDVETDAHIVVDQAVVDGEVYAIGRMAVAPGRGSAMAPRGGAPRGRGDWDDRPFDPRADRYPDRDPQGPRWDDDDQRAPRGRW